MFQDILGVFAPPLKFFERDFRVFLFFHGAAS